MDTGFRKFEDVEIVEFGRGGPSWRSIQHMPNGDRIVQFTIHRFGPFIRRIRIPIKTGSIARVQCFAYYFTLVEMGAIVSSSIDGYDSVGQTVTNDWMPFLQSGEFHNMGVLPYDEHIVRVLVTDADTDMEDMVLQVEFGF